LPNQHLQKLVARVAAAYFESTSTRPDDIGDVIQAVSASLQDVGRIGAPEEPSGDQPSVRSKAEVRKSIRPEALVSFEDGRSYKTLKRHLTGRGLTPAQYREKHGLPADYPMSAPAYSQARSEAAKERGFGRKATPTPEPEAKAKRARRQAPTPVERAAGEQPAAKPPYAPDF